MDFVTPIKEEFNLKQWQVKNVIDLIDQGNTIPFISRYRKEAHGLIDDQVLREISKRLSYLRNLDSRKEEIISLIESKGVMTDKIMSALNESKTITELEDIYRPFKPKRKTRASVAKEKGLEPLAMLIFEQDKNSSDPLDLAKKYINEEKKIFNEKDALAGAQDIIAEMISDDAVIRKHLRNVCMAKGIVKVSAADEENDTVYNQYYNFSMPVNKMSSHQILAINRGEKEKVLKVIIELDKAVALNFIYEKNVKNGSLCTKVVIDASDDAYDRLIFPAIERQVRSELKDKADEQAIKVFSLNLRNLLMQPPVKGKITMGLDPGYRTGCKVAVVDQTGKVLDTAIIYPTHSKDKVTLSKQKIISLIEKHNVNIIAIGNGTASKETEIFVVDVIKSIDKKVSYMVVSEAGASVYSASELSKEEFPDFDVTLRSAVSIARRLQDPLAELVKIDPKAIGVGQYQHDMPKKSLDQALKGVVEDCVNTVGVDLNTASWSLLSYVSGINDTVSKNIVKYREENGEFKSRAQLKKVSKLGPKVFEQCAGFLRVPESDNILDNTAVHPESYDAVRSLLSFCKCQESDLKTNYTSGIKPIVKQIGEKNLAEKLSIGLPTLQDILLELSRPGRDPRDELPAPLLRTDILDINDLKEGLELSGTVRNVIDFGAFIDIGVHQDGLLHISQICDRFIKHPSEVLKVGDIIKVRVLSVDAGRNRISLTMKGVG